MILSLKFREQFSGFLNTVGAELDNIVAVIRTWSNVEHNDDGTHSPNVGNTLQFLAGANIGAGQVVYISSGADQTAPGQAFLGDATSVSKSTQAAVVGLATMAVSAGQNVVTRDRGIFSGLIGLTAGRAYYLGTTPGGLTLTSPTNAVLIGVAISATELLLLLRNPTQLAGESVLSWTGPTSGTVKMQAGVTLPFVTAGTYSITVTGPVTVSMKGTAGGGGGGGGSSSAGNQRGGGGGGGGATTTGTSCALLSTVTYTLIVGAGGAGGASNTDGTVGANTKLSGSTTLCELAGGAKGVTSGGGGGVGGTVLTGSNAVTGGAGANDTGTGATAANGAGGGGGGGTSGSGGAGGAGSVAGGAGGAAGAAGTTKSGAGGGATGGAGGGGGAGGATFSITGESANGAGGGGGGGGGEDTAGSGATGGTGGAGVAALVFVSTP